MFPCVFVLGSHSPSPTLELDPGYENLSMNELRPIPLKDV
jgi:hypothetical protein